MPPKVNDIVFSALLGESLYWRSRGDALWYSAEAIRGDAEFVYSTIPFMDIDKLQTRSIPVDVLHVWGLLAGLSFELYLKATLIELVRPRDITHLPTSLKSHDLVKLAQLASVDASADERLMLRFLGKSVLWQGRYPIPTSSRTEWDGMYTSGHFCLAREFQRRICVSTK